jgi:hypothetical protein
MNVRELLGGERSRQMFASFLVQSFIVTDLFDPRVREALHPSIRSRDFHFHNQILHYTLDLYKGLFHKSISTHLSKFYFSTQKLF